MTDGAGLESLANAVIKLTGEVSEMRGEMRSFMDHKLAAEQRVEIRGETEDMIAKAILALSEAMTLARKADIAAMKAEALAYTDIKIKELEARLAAQEDRDKKREADIRTQFIGLGVVGIAGLAYAIFNLLTHGGG